MKIDLTNVSDAAGPLLGKYIKQFRPELDIYYITDVSLTHMEDTTVKAFRRIFYRMEDARLHLTIINGINERYETPFYCLDVYSKRPISVFHAMPISRNSVFKSRWISDFEIFMGGMSFYLKLLPRMGV